jgi:predicted ArsR family transcriptional regulator
MKEIITKLNKKFDNKTRLGIMSLLMVNEWVEFKTFKEMLGVSDGNLASHIKTLEAEKYLQVKKQFVGKKPQTSYAVTKAGRKAFNDHLDALEALLRRRN